MAYFCTNPEKADKCRYRFIGIQIGTDKFLCNILNDEKPCQDPNEDISIKEDKKNG